MIVLMSICLLAGANAEAAQRVYPFQNKEISGRFLREKRATVYGECSETEGCSYEELSETPYRWGYHRICQYFKSWKCGERNCGAGYMCATWSSNGCQHLNSYQVYCQEFDECSSSPCLNNGRCLDRVNSYNCKCAAGFEGTRCEKEIQTSTKDAVETKDPFEYTTPQPTSTGSKAHARYSTTFKISSLKENPLNTSYLSPKSEITILKTTMQQKTNYSPNGIMSTTSDDFMSTHPDDRMSTTSMPKIPDGLMSTEDNLRIITRTTLSCKLFQSICRFLQFNVGKPCPIAPPLMILGFLDRAIFLNVPFCV